MSGKRCPFVGYGRVYWDAEKNKKARPKWRCLKNEGHEGYHSYGPSAELP